ncbi:hypothetical protein cypCar_00026700 [Cyprinus carpio]|uniref:Interleukin-5 n=2 Tax=Cyprinus carpio TaxID=7962 RepID=A0A9J8BYU7_CYPCA|nr:uncharacterized protein LOC122147487 [Cyprinus carpio]KTG42818.1 hypothetical protein cypCar_00026700 [Cyprinus carpio]
MKLLGLLMTLFALSYANLDKQVVCTTLRELLNRLENLEKHEFKAFSKSVQIQTPNAEIQNARECDALLAKHLKHFIKSVKSAVPRNQYANILDNVNKILQETEVKNGSIVTCTFTTHNLTKVTPDDIKPLIQDNIKFIQKRNVICK